MTGSAVHVSVDSESFACITKAPRIVPPPFARALENMFPERVEYRIFPTLDTTAVNLEYMTSRSRRSAYASRLLSDLRVDRVRTCCLREASLSYGPHRLEGYLAKWLGCCLPHRLQSPDAGQRTAGERPERRSEGLGCFERLLGVWTSTSPTLLAYRRDILRDYVSSVSMLSGSSHADTPFIAGFRRAYSRHSSFHLIACCSATTPLITATPRYLTSCNKDGLIHVSRGFCANS